jgi:uncharacterized protein (DUF2249 family)
MLFIGISGIVASFSYGGTKQIYVYRVLGLDWWGHHVRPAMAEARVFLGLFAFVFTLGAILVVYDLMTLQRRALSDKEIHGMNNRLINLDKFSRWRKGMSRFEFGTWFLSLWVMGFIITLGLFAFGMNSVREGDPTIPNILALIGYGGLILITILFAARFLASFEARQDMLQLIANSENENVLVVDLNGHSEAEADKLVLSAFNSIRHGQAFEVVSHEDLKQQRLLLYDTLGPGFIWEIIEDGPERWKARVGKVN